MLIRILTENKNFQDVVKLTREKFVGATFIKAEGMWRSDMEHSLIIELDISKQENEQIERAEKLAYAIKKLNHQESVLVQYIPCESKMI